MTIITPQLALSIRFRGLNLPTSNVSYSNPRLTQIADRQIQLVAEIAALDAEIKQMADQADQEGKRAGSTSKGTLTSIDDLDNEWV